MSIEKLNINKLRSKIKDIYDLMICSSSFEERCKVIPGCFEAEDFDHVYVVENKDLPQYVGKNAGYLVDRFKGKSKKIKISIDNPLETADSLQEFIEAAGLNINIKNILVDISTFTHEALLILLNLFRLYCSEKKITFTYTGVSEYSVGDKVAHKWLSRGVEDVRSVLGFPGDILPSRKTHLIVLVGYEAERALNLIYSLEPHSISLGLGKSGSETTEKAKEANLHFHSLVEQAAISYCAEDIETFEIYCNDPIKTNKMILNEVEKKKDRNIIIAPMNNKVTTMGVALAAIERPEIQICYAQPIEYNFGNYSIPGDHCYLIKLPELFENGDK